MKLNFLPKEEGIFRPNIKELLKNRECCFKEESSFMGVNISYQNTDTMYCFVCFDSSNNLHLVNSLTNNHFIFYSESYIKDDYTSNIVKQDSFKEIESEAIRKLNSLLYFDYDKRDEDLKKLENDKNEVFLQHSYDISLSDIQKYETNYQDIYQDEKIIFNFPHIN